MIFYKIKLISILELFRYGNVFINDLFLCYLAIMGISNFSLDSDILSCCIGIGIVLWVFEFFQYIRSPFDRWKVNKLSKTIVVILAIYGLATLVISNDYKLSILFNLYIINYIIGKIISFTLDKERFAIRNKETLFHELGHFFICKEYKALNPEFIDMNTIGYSKGRLIANGNIEDVPTFKYVTMLLGGYVTEKYMVHSKRKFSLRELRNVLLIEYEDKTYSNDYLHDLVLIYLDGNMLQEAVNNILEIIDRYREDILKIAKESKYRKIIDLERYIKT